MSDAIRYDWTVDEVLALMAGPLDPLLDRARRVHAEFGAQDVQKCRLLSVKTGGCPEDCGYCSQSAHYKTEVKAESMLPTDEVLAAAREARDAGATRFCMGTAWRQVPEGQKFDEVLKMIRGVRDLGMEACVTLGMANEAQLKQMAEAGLTSYNHNLDTSREFYPKIVTTRTYEDRLQTLKAVRSSGVQICSGGILGMGESVRDRAAMLVELASFNPHPESVPVNLLVPIEGTPLEGTRPIAFEEFLRAVATARILMPTSRVRLSAGRNTLTEAEQLRCFEVGANSIFVGEKLLTAPNVGAVEDEAMYSKWEGQPASV
ncbi:MAG: biotin synthase BioB [Bdellovibrionaceae bacterium]|nr:biotin synthase BioB [Bdellovibrionales bacterium]MCB9253663.1 biotin synthase BioB [Pseudobdellovibrionaceae bacterium]